MTLFVLIFALAVSYAFIWSQNFAGYVDTLRKELGNEMIRSGEQIVVSPFNSTSLTISNPTSEVVVVTQVWSNKTLLWLGERGISPFGSTYYNFNGSNADGQFKVVTSRGNIFSGSAVDQFQKSINRAWQVEWYYNYTFAGSANPWPNYQEMVNRSIHIGTSYWYDLGFVWEWEFGSPVISNQYNLTNDVAIGFIANATVIKTSDNDSLATVNYWIDRESFVQFEIDGKPVNSTVDWFQWPNYASIVIPGEQYSEHTITVYFNGYRSVFGNANHYLRLNVVNASFAP